MLLEEKGNHQYHLATISETYNSDQPVRYTSATVAQVL